MLDVDVEGDMELLPDAGGAAIDCGALAQSVRGCTRLLDVGDHAPDFDLRRTFDERVRLSELRGPVLVHFYVFDFGGV